MNNYRAMHDKIRSSDKTSQCQSAAHRSVHHQASTTNKQSSYSHSNNISHSSQDHECQLSQVNIFLSKLRLLEG